MTLRQAVHDFIAALELSETERGDASRQHTYLRHGLAKRLELDPGHGAFLTGSYARSTAIRPLKDIDIFCVMTPTETLDPGKHVPAAALRVVKDALEATYLGKVAEPQNRSVNIEFSGTGIAYDVVPAFVDTSTTEEVFLIPDIDAGRWIRSNPKVHKEKSVAANAATSTELKPLTKAVKHWNRGFDKGVRLRSFHIEVMAWDVLTAPPESRLDGLLTLFTGLSERVHLRTPDPAGLGPDLDAALTWSTRQDAAQRFKEAASEVRRAQTLASDGRTEEAHHVLYSLFGAPYPEKGKPPATVAPMGAGAIVFPGAPDAHGSRFG